MQKPIAMHIGERPSATRTWHPHQLRHTAATLIRKAVSLDAARAVLGQRSLQVAEVYGEIDAALAADTARRLG